MSWYAGRSCAICGRAFRVSRWFGNKPALMTPEGMTIEVNDLPETEIESLLGTHQPVCWSCHLDRVFRRTYPKGA